MTKASDALDGEVPEGTLYHRFLEASISVGTGDASAFCYHDVPSVILISKASLLLAGFMMSTVCIRSHTRVSK